MQIAIQSLHLEAGQHLHHHVERRLRFALDRLGERIGRVDVRLADENGLRGGRDKACRIRVSIPRHGEVLIAQHAPNIYQAVDQAMDRLAHRIRHALGKVRRHGRTGSRTLLRQQSAHATETEPPVGHPQ